MPTLFPAIDLKEGACVRLRRGEMDEATLYNADPAAQAVAFADAGFSWLHIVDLDGAFAGESRNGAAVDTIVATLDGRLRIQLGGGLRTMKQIDSWLDRGIRRVILGTAALRDPNLVRDACSRFPGRIAVGIDARAGMVAIEGWAQTSRTTALDLARSYSEAGVAALIYTDIDRDGVLSGINWEATLELARAVPIPLIASGGLASMDDVRRLAAPDAAILEGAITGRALYDGRIDAHAALELLQG